MSASSETSAASTASGEEKPQTGIHVKGFFLNVLLLNKSEVVASKVAEKAGSGIFGRAAAFAANKIVTDEAIINTLADNLKEKIEAAVRDMGIVCEVQKKFQKGAFVTFHVCVSEVDNLQLILAVKGAEFASSFSTLLVSLGNLGLEETALPKINNKISQLVHEGMIRRFGEVVPQKMAEAGLNVQVNVCSPEDQAGIVFEDVENITMNHRLHQQKSTTHVFVFNFFSNCNKLHMNQQISSLRH